MVGQPNGLINESHARRSNGHLSTRLVNHTGRLAIASDTASVVKTIVHLLHSMSCQYGIITRFEVCQCASLHLGNARRRRRRRAAKELACATRAPLHRADSGSPRQLSVLYLAEMVAGLKPSQKKAQTHV